MSIHQGQNIQLFLAEGSSTGLRIAEIKFRSERVTSAVRSDLAKQRELEEVQRTGIYLLLGEPENPAYERCLYVGESDEVGKRLKQHAERAAKDDDYLPWWEQTVTITSNDANLTKAHALYLEAELIARAKTAARAQVVNVQGSDRRSSLSRADRSDMEVFLENVFVILPLLGVNSFRPRARVASLKPPSRPPAIGGDHAAQEGAPDATRMTLFSERSPVFTLSIDGSLLAQGQEVDGIFIVESGSRSRAWFGTSSSYKRLHAQLIESGALRPAEPGLFEFARDVEFSAPSAAAAVVSGRNANGRKAWRLPDGRLTYGNWQDQVTGANE